MESTLTDPKVTIVVVPRERFTHTSSTLKSIYENTSTPFKLVCVSPGAPPPIRRYLEEESQRKRFDLVLDDAYLSPNEARNQGLNAVHSKYVVFIDNDALVTPGWLEKLIGCAEETDASVVGPLYFIGRLDQQVIHMAGGRLFFKDHAGNPFLYDEQNLFDTPYADAGVLERKPWDYVEFHCMLVRSDVFERLGSLDTQLLSQHEHLDLCMSVRRAGGTVFLEPDAVTTYVPPPPCHWWDMPYFMLRWCEDWNQTSGRHFNQKWGVSFVRFFVDDAGLDQGDTHLRWARGHRRLITGTSVCAGEGGYRPDLPAEHAQLMIALFQSVDREFFDLNVTGNGQAEGATEPRLNPRAVHNRAAELLRRAEQEQLRVMVRPVGQRTANPPALLRVDDLDHAGLSGVQPHAFLTLETIPGRYQCWLAFAPGTWRENAQLRNLVGESGSAETAKDAWAPLAGCRQAGQARVRLVHGVTGLLTTVRQLEQSPALSYIYGSHVC